MDRLSILSVFVRSYWVLSNYQPPCRRIFMVSHFARFGLALLIAVVIGFSPVSVMAADPAPGTIPAPAAQPADKKAQSSKKDKKADKKSKKKSKKKAKATTPAQ
jgi:hypothetical protein